MKCRYKFVKNATAGALTVANFPVTNDGDDKQEKFVKHVLTANDIGTAAGQIGNTSGLILDVIPVSYNVLWFEIGVYRPTNVGGINQYNDLQNQIGTIDVDLTFTSFEVLFWLATDNTLRVFDKSHASLDTPLVAGDIITARVFIGPPQDSRDYMN